MAARFCGLNFVVLVALVCALGLTEVLPALQR